MLIRVGALRPILRWLVLVAMVLVGLDLALLVLRLSPGLPAPPWLDAGPVGVAISAALLALVLVLARRLVRALGLAEAAARQQQQVLDALQAGVVLFNADGRIAFCNEEFRRSYAALGAAAQPGATYEQLLRAVVAAGMAPDTAGQEEAWIARRLAEFGNTSQGLMRRMPDGRWSRIVELRLPDGGVLAHIVDVSEMVAKEQALDAARSDAEQARARLAGAIEALPATFELYDADDRLVLWNHRLAEAYPHMAPYLGQRLTFEQLTRLNLAGGGQPGFAERVDEWIAMRMAQRRGGEQPSQLMNNGGGRWLRMYETRLRDGSVVAIRVDVTDFEAQRHALADVQQELERSRQRLEDAIEAMPAGFELYDADDRLVMVNRMNLQMYPLLADLVAKRPTFEEVVRTNAARGGLPLITSAEQLDVWIERRIRERRNPAEVQVHQTSDHRWIRTYERRMRDGGLVAIRLDVSELVQREGELTALNAQLARLNEDLSVLSQTDPLTGLANRRAFDQRLAEEVSRAARHGVPLTLLLVDVDHFKPYNDWYGHPAGDACLRRLAVVLRECAGRPTDLAARLGGEEFALLLPHQGAPSALGLAERCVQAVDAAAIPHANSPVAAHVTVSVGAAELLGSSAQDGAALLAAADAALYLAKQQGRHRAAMAAAG
jgi:diguanylate cyclase (GGDEF)-like protein